MAFVGGGGVLVVVAVGGIVLVVVGCGGGGIVVVVVINQPLLWDPQVLNVGKVATVVQFSLVCFCSSHRKLWTSDI